MNLQYKLPERPRPQKIKLYGKCIVPVGQATKKICIFLLNIPLLYSKLANITQKLKVHHTGNHFIENSGFCLACKYPLFGTKVQVPDEAPNMQCIVGFTRRGSGSFVALLRSKLHKYQSIIRSAVMFHYTDAVNRMGKVGLYPVFGNNVQCVMYCGICLEGEMVVYSPSECNITQISA